MASTAAGLDWNSDRLDSEQLMRRVLLLATALLAQPASAKEIAGLGAVYLDTVNKVNIKAGVTLSDPYEFNPDMPHYYGSFHYMDVEVGLKGQKIGVGFGESVGHGLDRVGLSYAKLKSQDLAGIEAIISQMGMSTKLGYYYGLEGTENRFLLGLGFGF